MIKVLFVCHGNICRSTLAQSFFTYLVNTHGFADQFVIDSCATSREEIGNPPHRGTVNKLKEMGIPVDPHQARQITWSDYTNYDNIIGMDSAFIRILHRMLKGDPDIKISKLLDYTSRKGEDIADPWYTGNFDATYRDVKEGCEALLDECLLHL